MGQWDVIKFLTLHLMELRSLVHTWDYKVWQNKLSRDSNFFDNCMCLDYTRWFKKVGGYCCYNCVEGNVSCDSCSRV